MNAERFIATISSVCCLKDGFKMGLRRRSEKFFRGWIPKEPFAAYANAPLKPRWKRPAWVAFTLIAIVALSLFAYKGVQALIFYTNPQADVTASYYEKSLNCSTAKVGDVVEVQVRVYWHGHVFPEFKRQVEIIDDYAQGSFELVAGNNTLQYSGYGGDNHFKYLLKVTDSGASSELPQPKLYLDSVKIPLAGSRTTFTIN